MHKLTSCWGSSSSTSVSTTIESASETAASTTIVSDASTTTSAISSAITAGSTGVASIDCQNSSLYTTSGGVKYQEFCAVDWPVGYQDISGSGVVTDYQDVTTYTFEACMDACDNYNVKLVGQCKAVTYNANLTSAVAFSGGNCILKSSQANENVASGDLFASAVIVS